MKRIILIIILSLTIVFILFFLLAKKPAIASVNNSKIYDSDIEIHKNIKIILHNIDNYSDGNALFDVLRNAVFIELCKISKIDISKNTLNKFEKDLLSNNANIVRIKALLKNDFTHHFILPYYSNYQFVSYALNDTIKFQNKRFNEARNILNKWEDDYSIFLNDNTEYFESHNAVFDKQSVLDSFSGKYLNSDISYYYVFIYKDNSIMGMRVKKVSIEEIMKSLSPKINIELYDEPLARSLNKITNETYWNEIIFK